MSVANKRELESPAPDPSSKKRKTSDEFVSEEIEELDSTDQGVLASNPKNLLKSGPLPTGTAYQRKQIVLELYMAPVDAAEPLSGVERQLDDVLLTYVKEAEGILMGWTNARFMGRSARVLDESPFSLARVAVDTMIWRPRRGEELEGAIKLMGPSHIGILILGTFNASIPLTLIPQDWTFEENFEGDDGFWKDSAGTPLAIDQTLRFKTVGIKKGANILSVEGSLLEQVSSVKQEITTTTTTSSSSKADKADVVVVVNNNSSNKDAADAKTSERKAEKDRRRAEKKAAKSKRTSIAA